MTILNQKAIDARTGECAAEVDGAILSAIKTFLMTAADAELYNVNPFHFARARALNRIATTKAFLRLTEKGLFNLHWIVHCPSCKGPTQQATSLTALKHESGCPMCRIAFDANFDRSVEVSFSANPAIVRPDPVSFFDQIAATMATESGIAIDLDPGESHQLGLDLVKGNYMIFIPADQKAFNVAVLSDDGPNDKPIVLDYVEGQELLVVAKASAGPAVLRLTNRAATRKSFQFARMVPPSYPTAALVSSLQEFRELFSSQMLSPSETFSIESLAILFTDIKGSTELYERLGDSQAFHLVKEHFYIMERIVGTHDGAIVKTIGDAVMAVFAVPADALRSAVEMIEAFDDLETAQKLKNEIIVKIGIHYGPCIAVTLNNRIDYFGTTVNIAARVQGLSDGRDVMASEALYGESDGAAYLSERRWQGEPFQTSLKGLQSSYRVFKLARQRR